MQQQRRNSVRHLCLPNKHKSYSSTNCTNVLDIMSASNPTTSLQRSTHRRVVIAVVSLLFLSLTPPTDSWSASQLSRRDLLRAATSAVVTSGIGAGVLAQAPLSAWAATDLSTLKDELSLSKSKLQEIPDLLQAQEWDKVRNILKTPPVNKLWNLGDSQNTVLKLAKETGDVELFELKDELAYNLQMCDQLTYDNVFVYFQPGSGKIKIKEPVETAQKAVSYLDQIIAAAN